MSACFGVVVSCCFFVVSVVGNLEKGKEQNESLPVACTLHHMLPSTWYQCRSNYGNVVVIVWIAPPGRRIADAVRGAPVLFYMYHCRDDDRCFNPAIAAVGMKPLLVFEHCVLACAIQR